MLFGAKCAVDVSLHANYINMIQLNVIYMVVDRAFFQIISTFITLANSRNNESREESDLKPRKSSHTLQSASRLYRKALKNKIFRILCPCLESIHFIISGTSVATSQPKSS